MSIDASAANFTPVSSTRRRPWLGFWTQDLRTARVIRYAVGVTAAVAVAFGIEWPLFFLTPLFTAVFLALPLPGPTLGKAFETIGYVLIAFSLGLVFTLFLLPYPLVYLPMLGLVLFHIYYLANRGGPFFLVLMSLVAVLLLPMLGMAYEAIPIVIALYFALSSFLAVVFVILAHGLFPDPPAARAKLPRRVLQRGYSPKAASAALRSTIVTLPLAVLFISASWTSQVLVMVFAAIFSLSPEVSAGRASAEKTLISTLMGGAVALVFYYLIVAVPELHFFIPLMLVTMLTFGMGIFSDHPYAKYLSSAATGLLVLLGSGMAEGASIADAFITRVALISAAALYIVAALSVLDRFFPRRI